MDGILKQNTPLDGSNVSEIPKRYSTAHPSNETRRKDEKGNRDGAARISKDRKSGNVVDMLRGQSRQRKSIYSPDRWSYRLLKRAVNFNDKIGDKSDVKNKDFIAKDNSFNVGTKCKQNTNEHFISKEKKVDEPKTQQKRSILSSKNIARADRQKYCKDKVKQLKHIEKTNDTFKSRQNDGPSKVVRKHKFTSSYDNFSSYDDEGITEYPPVKHSSSEDSRASTSSSSGREVDVSSLVDHSNTPLDTDDNSSLPGWEDRSNLPLVCGIHSCENIDYCDTLSDTSKSTNKASYQLQEIFVNKKGKQSNRAQEDLKAKQRSEYTNYLSPRQKPNQKHKREVRLIDSFNPLTKQFKDINEKELVPDLESLDSFDPMPSRRHKYHPIYRNFSSEKVDVINTRNALLNDIDWYEKSPKSGRNRSRNKEYQEEIAWYRDPSLERLNSVSHSKEGNFQNIAHKNTCKTKPGIGHQGSHMTSGSPGTSQQNNARPIVAMPSTNWQRIERTSDTIPSATWRRDGSSIVAIPGTSRQGYQMTNDTIPETTRQGRLWIDDEVPGTSWQCNQNNNDGIPGTSWQCNQRNNDAISGTKWQRNQNNNDVIPGTRWQRNSETYDEISSRSGHCNEMTNDATSGTLWKGKGKGKGKSTKGKSIESRNQKRTTMMHVGENDTEVGHSTAKPWNTDILNQNPVENVHDSRNMGLIKYRDRNIIDTHGYGPRSPKYAIAGANTRKTCPQEVVCDPNLLDSKQVAYEHNARANDLILHSADRPGIVAGSGKKIPLNKNEGQVKQVEISNHREAYMGHPDRTHYKGKYASQEVDRDNSMPNPIAFRPCDQTCASPLGHLENQKQFSHYMAEKHIICPNPKVPLSEEEENSKKWGDFYKYLAESRGDQYSKPKQDGELNGVQVISENIGKSDTMRVSGAQDTRPYGEKIGRLSENQHNKQYQDMSYGRPTGPITIQTPGAKDTKNYDKRIKLSNENQQNKQYLRVPRATNLEDDNNISDLKRVIQGTDYVDVPNTKRASDAQHVKSFKEKSMPINENQQNPLYLDTPYGVRAPGLTYPEHGDQNTNNWNEVEQDNRHIDGSCSTQSLGAQDILANEKVCIDWLVDISVENERYNERAARMKRYSINDPSMFKRLWKLRNGMGSHKSLTKFSNLYDGGHFPMYVEYKGQHIRRLVWLYDIGKLNYKLYLPIFFNGLKEDTEPYNFCARQAIHEILPLMSWDDIKSVLNRLVPPIIFAIKSKNSKIISSTLLAIQDLSKCGPVDMIVDILQPPLAYTLPILNLFRADNYTSGEHQFKGDSDEVPLRKLVSKTLKLFRTFVDVSHIRRRSPARINEPEEERDPEVQVNPLATTSRKQH